MGVTATELRRVLESAVEATTGLDDASGKRTLLNRLHEELARRDLNSEIFGNPPRFLRCLEQDVNRWPVHVSRLRLDRLPAEIEHMSWKKFDGALGYIANIVEEAITVEAFGDGCNVCLDGPRVYAWCPDQERIVCECETCGTLTDLQGNPVAISGGLETPSSEQLEKSGALRTPGS